VRPGVCKLLAVYPHAVSVSGKSALHSIAVEHSSKQGRRSQHCPKFAHAHYEELGQNMTSQNIPQASQVAMKIDTAPQNMNLHNETLSPIPSRRLPRPPWPNIQSNFIPSEDGGQPPNLGRNVRAGTLVPARYATLATRMPA